MSEVTNFLNGLNPSRVITDRVKKLGKIEAKFNGLDARREKLEIIIAKATEELKQLVTASKSNGSRKPKRDSSELSKTIDLGNESLVDLEQSIAVLRSEDGRHKNAIHELIKQQIKTAAYKKLEASEQNLRDEMERYCSLYSVVCGTQSSFSAKVELRNMVYEMADQSFSERDFQDVFDSLHEQAYSILNQKGNGVA